jgi:hypothetical protein
MQKARDGSSAAYFPRTPQTGHFKFPLRIGAAFPAFGPVVAHLLGQTIANAHFARSYETRQGSGTSIALSSREDL